MFYFMFFCFYWFFQMAKATRYLSLKIGMKIINKNVLLCFLWF